MFVLLTFILGYVFLYEMDKRASQQTKFYDELGANIQKHRKGRDLSQDALAKLVGLTRTSLTNIEKGRQHPPLHTLCEIAEQLKVDVSELLPRSAPIQQPLNLKAFAEQLKLRDNEVAFIETAIKGGPPHDDTKKQD